MTHDCAFRWQQRIAKTNQLTHIELLPAATLKHVMTKAVQIATFYRFTPIERPGELRARLHKLCLAQQLLGTILLASEGINATVCGAQDDLQQMLNWLQTQPGLADLKVRYSSAKSPPFKRMLVKLRREIVSFGQDDIDVARETGAHVPPEVWDQLIGRDDVRLIDTRNDYEVGLGSFAGAEDPQTRNFRDFAAYVQQQLDPERDRHVAMYCTGGIRCEKASAWLRQQGFEHVYQLDGGILNYLQKISPEQSSWHGECFVFDDRVCLDQHLQPTERPICHACRMPLSAGEMASPHYQLDISCPHCINQLTPEREASLRERSKQRRLQHQTERGASGPAKTDQPM